jgi:apolipoprotein N-acyltransferase
MPIIFCTLLSAIAFYFSIGLGDQWWLAWLAPIPILWLAFGDTKPWPIFFASWAAAALGGSSILRAYAGTLPLPVLILAIAGPSLLFAASVMGARRVFHAKDVRHHVMATFAFLWAGWDFLASFDSAGGTVATQAASQVGAPLLIQSAALFGFTGITFLIGLFAVGIALSLRTRTLFPAGLAIVVFAANAGYGYWRMSQPPTAFLHVALIESDDATGPIHRDDKTSALKAIHAYLVQIAKLREAHVQLIVLPENIAQIGPAWRDEAQLQFVIATTITRATIVAGFNTFVDGAQRNVSWSFTPGQSQPVTYEKRRLVPGLETRYYTPGPGPKALANGTGLEICKNMDFQAMIRADEVATKPQYLAVPAWDFDKDDWSHARVAILRSVENGVPMARVARDGLLTLNDRYGRLIARARSTGAFQTLIGDLPLDGRGGETFYDRIGDLFGWICVVFGFGLVGTSFVRRKTVPPVP